MEKSKIIRTRDLIWSGMKLNFLQSSWNFERLQNVGFLFSIYNMINKIYIGNNEGRLAAIKRHMAFFNTHIFFSSAALGVITRLEADLSENDIKMKDTEIENTKMGIMGPLAAIGDSLFWSGIRPLALLLGAGIVWITDFSLFGWVIASLTALVVYNLPRFIIKYFLLFEAYFNYKNLFILIQKVEFQKIMKSIQVVGMGILGIVTAIYIVRGEIHITENNGIMDDVLIIFWFLVISWALRSKKSLSNIFIAVVVISILISYIT